MHLTRSVAGAAVCCWLAPVALAQADEATMARIRAGNFATPQKAEAAPCAR